MTRFCFRPGLPGGSVGPRFPQDGEQHPDPTAARPGSGSGVRSGPGRPAAWRPAWSSAGPGPSVGPPALRSALEGKHQSCYFCFSTGSLNATCLA